MLVYQRVQTMVLTPKSLRLPCRTSLKATVNHLQSPPANCPKLVEGWRGSFRWAWPGAGFSDPFFLFQRSWMWIRNLEPVDIRWYYIYIYVYMLQCAWCKYIYMVGGFNHFEKYEFVNGEDDIPYMKWNIIYIYIYHQWNWVVAADQRKRLPSWWALHNRSVRPLQSDGMERWKGASKKLQYNT